MQIMALKSLSTRELRRELERREAGASKLAAQHRELTARLSSIDAELALLGMDGAPARRGRPGPKPGRKPGRPRGTGTRGPRAKNAMSLIEAILQGVSSGSTVSPAQAAEAARKTGYKSSSPHFGMMVANALAKAPQFKRLGRGQYKRVGGAGRPAGTRGKAKAKAAPTAAARGGKAARKAGKRAGPRRKAGRKQAAASSRAKARAPRKAGRPRTGARAAIAARRTKRAAPKAGGATSAAAATPEAAAAGQ
jgi:hypothetical protein